MHFMHFSWSLIFWRSGPGFVMDPESTFMTKKRNLQYWNSKHFAFSIFWLIFPFSRSSSITLDFRIQRSGSVQKNYLSDALAISSHAVGHGWIDFEFYSWDLCHQIYLNSFQNCKMVDPGLLGLLQLAKRFNNVHLADCQAGLRIGRWISGPFCSEKFNFFGSVSFSFWKGYWTYIICYITQFCTTGLPRMKCMSSAEIIVYPSSTAEVTARPTAYQAVLWIGSGTFWPGRIRIRHSCTGYGSDLFDKAICITFGIFS